ncbi:hypothetical protein NQ117_03030 [Paenibacillus sp. SC116]|uniref:hypothetical protein n=1 Tax=Paenibacillus sp. SC116 TaxID=2968986 RepID=UPI00215B4AB2|nr:hypothetical protein [Paenibacillus sp. SC116]MCR8842644.1 hypothetical protein [Paenibacillus sp. SC116]
MSIQFYNRTVSSDSSTYVALDRASAIAQARAQSGVLATNVGREFAGWPILLPYVNDNSPAAPVFNQAPQFVWDSFTTTPQTRFFAAPQFGVLGLATDESMLFDLRVFCDNAHDVRIDLFDETAGDLFATITPAANLIDGSLDPNAGIANDVPYNWLNIRYYSNISPPTPPERSGNEFSYVISFQVVNYNIIPPVPNPAGLMFALDLWYSSSGGQNGTVARKS